MHTTNLIPILTSEHTLLPSEVNQTSPPSHDIRIMHQSHLSISRALSKYRIADWIVKPFCRYILEDYTEIGLKSAISPDKFHHNSFSRMHENFHS